ncbi:hypothetical protein ACQ4PT_065419 [Festuca glaucescens]
MAPSLRRRQRRTGQDKATLPIADDLLAEIFLRFPTPADLVRAAAVCPSFRRVATDRSFIRQFRKLHAPLLLGLVTCDGFHQVLPPHPSAPAAQALALAADFSFSVLPSLGRWCVHDARDGRVLLRRKPENKKASVIFTEVVVCDPLHRRHLLLPPVPKDLQDLVVRHIDVLIGPSLAPPSEEEEVEETSFRVIYMARCKTQPVALIFSSNTGQWRGAASQSWSDLEPSTEPITAWGDFLYRSHYAYGCFYWEMDFRGKLLVLHTRSMEFSIVDPPPGAGEWRHVERQAWDVCSCGWHIF